MELLLNFLGESIVLLLLLFYFLNDSLYTLELFIDEIKNKDLIKIFISPLFIVVKDKKGPSVLELDML